VRPEQNGGSGAEGPTGSPVFLPFPPDLRGGVFLDRPNRFLARIRLDGAPHPVEAHLPDPGRLRELLVTGRRIFAAPVHPVPGRPARRTQWSLLLVETPPGSGHGSGWVSLDTTLPNRLLRVVLEGDGLAELPGWILYRAEAPVGNSRFDFVLRRRGEPSGDFILEAKSVTLVDAEGCARFPDAPTDRGARHVREMAHLVAAGTPGAVVFLVQRDDAAAVEAAWEIDPAFAEALDEARDAGVQIFARQCRVLPSGITLLPDPLPVRFASPPPPQERQATPRPDPVLDL
jgi:sugar fermentation stimulation protein A